MNVDGTRELLERVLLALVSVPEAVRLHISTVGDATTFAVHVAQVDIGRVIGDDGRTVRALRMILGAVGLRQKIRFILDIEDIPNVDEGSPVQRGNVVSLTHTLRSGLGTPTAPPRKPVARAKDPVRKLIGQMKDSTKKAKRKSAQRFLDSSLANPFVASAVEPD